MKCSPTKCIVSTISVHGRLRPGRMFLKRPDGVVCEQSGEVGPQKSDAIRHRVGVKPTPSKCGCLKERALLEFSLNVRIYPLSTLTFPARPTTADGITASYLRTMTTLPVSNTSFKISCRTEGPASSTPISSRPPSSPGKSTSAQTQFGTTSWTAGAPSHSKRSAAS